MLENLPGWTKIALYVLAVLGTGFTVLSNSELVKVFEKTDSEAAEEEVLATQTIVVTYIPQVDDYFFLCIA